MPISDEEDGGNDLELSEEETRGILRDPDDNVSFCQCEEMFVFLNISPPILSI